MELSYAFAPTKYQNVYKTPVDMVNLWAKLYPDKDAFVEYTIKGDRRSLSCSELLIKAKLFGRFLMENGIIKGDVVVLCLKNSLEMIIAICGVYFCGGIVSCTSMNLENGSDVIEHLSDTRAKVLVIDTHSESSWNITRAIIYAKNNTSLKRIICNNGDIVLSEDTDFAVSFEDAFNILHGEDVIFPSVYPEDIVQYLTTSGSSGKPKLAAHVAYTWIANTAILNEACGIDASSVYFCERPFGWGVGSPRTFFASGATRVFVDTSISIKGQVIDQISSIIARESCTHAYLPGYIVADLHTRPDLSERFATLQKAIFSGERIPNSHWHLIGRFYKQMCIWYGSTEMNGVSCFISESPDTLEEDGLIGRPTPGSEMKVVEHDGNIVPVGQKGELCTRSIHRFSKYIGMPEKFHEVVDSNNWFHSGDICYMRRDGNFIVCGRISEQISIATMKIYPAEIEKKLCKAPGVNAVMAVPVPDKRLNNAICACMVMDKTSSASLKDIEEFCNKTWTAASSATGISLRPKYFLEFEEILTNINGKFDRKRMALEAKKRLSL